MKRRHFVQSASALAATVLTSRVGLSGQSGAPSDRVNLAVIGVNGRGMSLISTFAKVPNARIVTICDTDERTWAKATDAIKSASGEAPKAVSDLRRVLDDKSIDAVIIATPDHWHAPATILACEAGKDVYVEKPASHNLREGRLMVNAARQHKRVVQHGTQSRSRPSTQRGVEYVKSGKIGKVLMAKAWDVQLRDDIGHVADSPVPAGVDYDTWTGPAMMLPFNLNRFHYKWHWNWNYGTGDAGNDGVHQIDIARWALGVDYPTEAAGLARKLFFQDDQITPDTINVTYNCGDKMIAFEMRIWNPYRMEGVDNGVAVYGSEGMVHIGRWNGKWGFKVFDQSGKETLFDNANEPDNHAENFVQCIRSRKAPNAEIEIGHISTVYAHLANVVARTSRALKFDPKAETIIGDTDANRFLTRPYRKHWGTPKGVATA